MAESPVAAHECDRGGGNSQQHTASASSTQPPPCAIASESGGMRGALHPELQMRLQNLGMLKQTEIAPSPMVVPRLRLPASATIDDSGTSTDPSFDRTTKKGQNNGKLDPDVDDLLSQLDSLDARSKALQKESRTRESVVETAPAEEGQAGSDRSVAKMIVRQHPLESVPLVRASSSVSDNRWPAARCRREYRQPIHADGASDAFWAAPHKGSQAVDYPPSVPASDRRRCKASSNCVSLPPLKPSASAPACLVSSGKYN